MLKGYGWVGGRLVALKILETPRVKIPVFYLTLGLDLRLGLGLVYSKKFNPIGNVQIWTRALTWVNI